MHCRNHFLEVPCTHTWTAASSLSMSVKCHSRWAIHASEQVITTGGPVKLKIAQKRRDKPYPWMIRRPSGCTACQKDGRTCLGADQLQPHVDAHDAMTDLRFIGFGHLSDTSIDRLLVWMCMGVAWLGPQWLSIVGWHEKTLARIFCSNSQAQSSCLGVGAKHFKKVVSAGCWELSTYKGGLISNLVHLLIEGNTKIFIPGY